MVILGVPERFEMKIKAIVIRAYPEYFDAKMIALHTVIEFTDRADMHNMTVLPEDVFRSYFDRIWADLHDKLVQYAIHETEL